MLRTVALLGVLAALPACGDLIYDDPEPAQTDWSGYSVRSLDASSYTAWVYVDLSERRATVVNFTVDESTHRIVANDPEIPDEWDFALHRWDCKTNGGAAAETSLSSLDGMTAAQIPSADAFVADEVSDDRIVYDMSGMMEGELGYLADEPYNAELSKWINVDLSSMPPAYTPSNKVYVLRTRDGEYAAIRFTDYVSDSGTKGFLSFDYIYPLE